MPFLNVFFFFSVLTILRQELYFNSCGCSASMCMQLGKTSLHSLMGEGKYDIILLLRVNLHSDCLHLSGLSQNEDIDNRVVIPSPDKLVWA